MKAAVNGALHLSVLDGWWDEGYSPDCGWAIGNGEEYSNLDYQDDVESQAVYNLLENEIIPCFYDRSDSDVPKNWVKMMKASMTKALSSFTSHRMVGEYEELLYKPAMAEHESLWTDNAARAHALVALRERFQLLWKHIKVLPPEIDRDISLVHVGDDFEVTARVELGELKPDEVDAEVYYGPVNANNEITSSQSDKLLLAEEDAGGKCVFRQRVKCRTTGRYGLAVRITPRGTDWRTAIPGFITWAEGS
jgi:starch phosphorylase